MRINEKEQARCPWCGEDLESVAEDYVIPGRPGRASSQRDECWECNQPFLAYRDGKDIIFEKED